MSEPTKKVSADPTPGLSYDPSQPVYWDPAALHGEVLRAFDICNGCRMCFKFCDSFPRLFELLDQRDHDVHTLRPSEIQGVMDDCFQCKLCEVQCPYTPRDNHPFQLDFPALVHRYDAQEFRARGGKPTLREKFLGDPDLSGKMARMSLGLANAMNKVAPARFLMEKVLGVDRHAALPDFATAPARLFVACLLAGALRGLNWDDLTDYLPAVVTALAMPFTFSIAVGIGLGFIVHAVVKTLAGRPREVGGAVWLIAAASAVKFAIQ